MADPAMMLLAGLCYLLAKHVVADFFLQTRYQWSNKGTYGHPGGFLHAAIHAGLSAPVLMILPPATATLGATLLIGEFALHYHIDWLKEQVVRRGGWTTANDQFWMALGVDQFAHHLTYLAMVAALTY